MGKFYCKWFVSIVAAVFTASHVQAQVIPEELKGKTVTISVPASAGGNIDALARIMVQRIEQQHPELKIIVVNKPGANGVVSARAVADSDPNGLLIGQFVPAHLALNSLNGLPGSVTYGELNCFHTTVKWASVLFVRSELPFNNIKQMADHLKKDDKSSYASLDLNTSLLAEQLLEELNVKNVIGISYKGVPDGIRAVLAKEVTFGIAPVAEVVPFIRDGRLKGIAVGTQERSQLIPDVPSVTEHFKNVTMENSVGYCVSRKTPRKLMEYFNEVFDKAVKSPEYVEFLAKRGQVLTGGDVAAADKWYEDSWRMLRQRYSKYGHLIKVN
jgi:tripartite-type tricarboxylate transporter receptor subunit TctC